MTIAAPPLPVVGMRPPRALLRTFLAAALALVASCGSVQVGPPIAEIYRSSALMETRNPVIVVHGILGARLVQRSTKKIVWGAFTADSVDPNTAAGACTLALPCDAHDQTRPYDVDAQDVYADGPLDQLRVSFLFSVLNVSVYAQIIKALGAGGYSDPVLVDRNSPRYADDHFTCYTFFYDWRRDCVENAMLLGKYIATRRAQIVRSAGAKAQRLRASGDPSQVARGEEIDAWLARGFKFDIVAHSMGGLIARYYLQYGAEDLPADGSVPTITWAGAKEVDRLVQIGTPNLGSMDAFDNLVNGSQLSFLLPRYDPAILGTMPALYQLLPRTRHRLFVDPRGAPVDLDLFDPAVWERNEWGLLDPASDRVLRWLLPKATAGERRDAARRHLVWCLERARRFHAAMDRQPTTPPPQAEIHLYAGDNAATLTRAILRPEAGKLVPQFAGLELLYEPGDEVVARYSAIGDERQARLFRIGAESAIPWTGVTFLSDNHLGLTRNPMFTNNLLFTLLDRTPPSLLFRNG